jgi:hypothetical protein
MCNHIIIWGTKKRVFYQKRHKESWMIKFERKPMLLNEVLRNSLDLYRASFFSVWFWNLILGFIYALPLLIGFLGIYEVDQHGHFHFSVLGTFIFITFLIISSYLSILTLEIMQGIIEGTKTSINFFLKDSMVRLFPVYLGMLVYYLIILIGFMLFLFPGVFVWILFIMFLPLMIFENLSIFDSFTASMRMVWGSWWQTFFVMFIPAMVMYLLRNFFRYAPFYSWFIFLLEVLVISLTMPYFYAAMLIQFTNLKIKISLPKPPDTQESSRLQS